MVKGRKKIRNNVEDTEEESGSVVMVEEENLGEFRPKNEGLYNRRRVMTAPD